MHDAAFPIVVFRNPGSLREDARALHEASEELLRASREIRETSASILAASRALRGRPPGTKAAQLPGAAPRMTIVCAPNPWAARRVSGLTLPEK